MRRITAFVVIFMIIILSGCEKVPQSPMKNILSPKNGKSPIEGKWQLNIYNGSNEDTAEIAQFTNDAAVVLGIGYGNVNYKVKKVKINDYLLFNKHKVTPEKLKIKGNEVIVVTVTSSDTLIGDFIATDEKTAVAFVDSKIYFMDKVSDVVDRNIYENISSGDSRIELQTKSVELQSGVLIGLKSKNKNEEYDYRTIWISSKNKKVNPIRETQDLLFPRKTGFWKLSTKRVKEGTREEDILIAYDVSRKSEMLSPPSINYINWKDREGKLYKNITYLCNDYVSVEIQGEGKITGTKEKWNENKLQVKPIDNISSSKGVKISELAGTNGVKALNSGKKEAVAKLNEVVEINNSNEENFGVVRKAGHWILNGRLNYEDNQQMSYLDYNINIVPPEKLVFYDTFHLKWSNIKNEVPDAIDGYTSPNNDIAIIITKTKLYVYGITNGRLDKEPFEKMEIKEGESAVMAEWATGSYVDNWDRIFLSVYTDKVK